MASAQSVLPNWVRGRGLAVYLTVFNGAMTAGSLGWGAVGEAVGIQSTLIIGAIGLLIAGFIMHRVKLPPAISTWCRRTTGPSLLSPNPSHMIVAQFSS